IAVALRSSRTRTTVPSRMRRMIGSADRAPRVQQTPSVFHLSPHRPHAPVPSIPVCLHLAPHPADHVFTDRSTEERAKCPADPARVGAGQIGASNQRLGPARQALVGREGRVAALLVLLSGGASRARGTQTVTAPNVPIRVRSRWPWRWPDT